MSIPLIQKPEKDDINTSIIAIKRNIERINMLLGLSNSEEIDTSEFVKKSDIVDEVTVGNMQSVTSNAVAECLRYSTDEVDTGKIWTDGSKVYRKVYVYSGVSLQSGSKLVDNNFISKLKICSLQGLISAISSSWISLPYFLYVVNKDLYVGQNITSDVIANIQVIVEYIK